jgi:hypothetical protein
MEGRKPVRKTSENREIFMLVVLEIQLPRTRLLFDRINQVTKRDPSGCVVLVLLVTMAMIG